MGGGVCLQAVLAWGQACDLGEGQAEVAAAAPAPSHCFRLDGGSSACPVSPGCRGHCCFLKKQKIIFFTESKLFFLFLYHFSDVIFTFAPILICWFG